jgi:hypothetical protein
MAFGPNNVHSLSNGARNGVLHSVIASVGRLVAFTNALRPRPAFPELRDDALGHGPLTNNDTEQEQSDTDPRAAMQPFIKPETGKHRGCGRLERIDRRRFIGADPALPPHLQGDDRGRCDAAQVRNACRVAL